MANHFHKDYGDTAFITGLRAFAALAVVLIHSGGAGFRELGVIGNNIADIGRTGVYAFFVISGFSVAVSYSSSGGYADYINKRLWRIAPLYYFWLILSVALGAISTAVLGEFKFQDISLYNWMLHIFFLGFIDYTVTNSIIGVEWSISIEVFWYFLVPLLLYFSRTKRMLVFTLIFSFIVYALSQKYAGLLPVNSKNSALAMHWSPIPYFLSFMLGISAYKIRMHLQPSKYFGGLAIGASISILLIHVCAPLITNLIFRDEFILVSLITTLLIICGSEKSDSIKMLFCNPVVQFLGVISYGIYLSHVPIMGLLLSLNAYGTSNSAVRFIMIAGVSILVSAITYLLIEKKFNSFCISFGARHIHGSEIQKRFKRKYIL